MTETNEAMFIAGPFRIFSLGFDSPHFYGV